HTATAGDIYSKMVTVGLKLRKLKNIDVLRIEGCPVSVAEQVLVLIKLGHLKNPYFDPKMAAGFTLSYLSWRTRTAIARILGTPYQKPGAVERGEARPTQNLPPEGAVTPLEVH
ncbi:MAG: DUF362 domain-containing protein, partial [Myxococcales bacterium]|nr:DUF362 domain-containing protein [Myxococcales bacterium]